MMSSATNGNRPAPTFLRLSAGFVYFFFGFSKFFPDLSPGELLAGQTIMRMSLHWLDASTALWWLALAECVIGLSFLFNVGMRWTFFLFLFHQAGTFFPLFMLPELTFKIAPFAPTLEGQYILKNVVSVAAGWTVMLPAVKEGWKDTFCRLRAWKSGAAEEGLLSDSAPAIRSGLNEESLRLPIAGQDGQRNATARPAARSTSTVLVKPVTQAAHEHAAARASGGTSEQVNSRDLVHQ